MREWKERKWTQRIGTVLPRNLAFHQKTVVHIYTMEFYAAERKEELQPFATAWMELESIILSEISQAVKDKYHMISPISIT